MFPTSKHRNDPVVGVYSVSSNRVDIFDQLLPQHDRAPVFNVLSSNWPTKDANGTRIMTQAVILGLGSMFNHSSNQNVGWERDVHRQVVTYRAIRDIQDGEELCATLYQLHALCKNAFSGITTDKHRYIIWLTPNIH